MAGFDFEFHYEVSQHLLLEVCLRAAKARARKLGISWRNERLGPRSVRCVINGNTRRLDLLADSLERDLPLVAEGAEHSGLPAARRKRLGLGFADLYVRGRDMSSDGPWQWRGTTQTRYRFAPYETTSRGAPPTLGARLAVTEGVITDWCFERVPAVVLLEELHTACELLLEYLVNPRSKRLSFAQLLDEASDAGLLRHPMFGRDVGEVSEIWGISAAGGDGKQLLTELKDYRKNARHRADMSFEPWLRESWERIVLLIEHLAAAHPRAPS